MRACEWCGQPFEAAVRRGGVRGGRPQRFCSSQCADDSWNARKRIGPRPERLGGTGRKYKEMPPGPFASGLCTTLYRGKFWWSSDKPAERQQAAEACQACPVLSQCREWALSHVRYGDTTGVYAGMSAVERRREQTARHKAAQEAVSVPPRMDGMPGAA